MTLAALLLRRIAAGFAAAWAVFSGVFLLLILTRDWYLEGMRGMAIWGGADEEDIRAMTEAYLVERGLDRSMWEIYLDWLWNAFTFQWGNSFETGAEVRTVIFDATIHSATYVVPAVLLALSIGTVAGMLGAMHGGSTLDRGGRMIAYALYGIPKYWIGAAILLVIVTGVHFTISRRLYVGYETVPSPFVTYGLATLLVTSLLLAGQVSYSRAYSLEYLSGEYVTLVRAKGAGMLTVTRHVLRNISVPLVSLVFTEMVGLLALSVFVLELLLNIPGLGAVLLGALWTHDLPVIIGGTMVVIVITVVGNIIQDVAYTMLDPRIDTGTRHG